MRFVVGFEGRDSLEYLLSLVIGCLLLLKKPMTSKEQRTVMEFPTTEDPL